MNKFLKIGIPILVAVLVLIMGTGLVLAKMDTPVLTGSQASYDAGYSWCPQHYGPQYSSCPFAGNNGRWGGCTGGGYGAGGWSDDGGANYQPPSCHGYYR